MRKNVVPIRSALGQLALSLILLAFAVYMFDRLTAMELAGEAPKLPAAIKLIYLVAGKWAVVGVIAFAGVVFVGTGSHETWRKLRAIRQAA